MNSFKLNPNQTLYYTYHPESDKLAIRLRPELGKITSTTLPDMPHVQVSRDIRSHAVVGLNISGVQQLILQQFIKSAFEQLEPYFEEADPSEETATADPVIPDTIPNTNQESTSSSVADASPEEEKKPKSAKAKEQSDIESAVSSVETASDTQAHDSNSPSRLEPPKTTEVVMTETAEASDAQGEAQEAQETVEATEASDAQAEAQEAQDDTQESRDVEVEVTEPNDVQVEAQEVQETQQTQQTQESRDAQAKTQEAENKASDAQGESQETQNKVSDAQAEAQEAENKASDAQVEAQEAENKASDAQVEAQEAENKASDTQGEAQEANEEVKKESKQDNKPKRPRRRRRKKKSAEKAKAAESGAKSNVVETEVVSSKDPSLTADQTNSVQPRKRRRKRKKKKSETSAALTEQIQHQDTSEKALPVTVEREIVPTLSWEERIKDDPRRSYKTNPIPGLGAPEGFAFIEMDDLIGQALYALGFLEPTPIQAKAIPPALEGRDIIGLAQTGTGKTLSFIIPILQNLLINKSEDHIPRALIMTPTRELAVQIAEDAEFAGTHTDLLITTIYGGVGFKQQVKELREGTDIIVATPGRLLDHMKQRTLNLDEIAILVLDEADRMLDMGFLPEIRRIMRQLPNDYQSLLFSATMPSAIERLSSDFQHQPQVIEIARQLPPETISQYLYPVEKHLKVPLLVHLLQEAKEMNSVLIFTETKSEAEVVARRLERASLTVALMHGDRKQREREKALQDLRTGAVRILVATNVAARGLDINDISHVINYDMPQSVDDYIHRIGRTARGDATGQAYTFVTIADEGMVSRIESALKRELPREWAEEFNYDVPTPSWARPSVDQIIESLHKTEGLAERFNRMMRRR